MKESPSKSSLASAGSAASFRSSASSRRSRGGRRSKSPRGQTHSPPVNPIDLVQLRARFDKFDKDGSGYLEPDECQAALSILGSNLKFDELDTDNDNRISFEEFAVLTELATEYTHPIFKGASRKTVSTTERSGIAMAFAGDAHLNVAFMNIAGSAWRKLGQSARAQGFNEVSLKQVFRNLDLTQDGSLDHGEVRKGIKSLAPQLSEVDIKIMLACADKDADGKISEAEFTKLMLHDHENDLPYWEKYSKRDMHTRDISVANPWL